MVYLQLWYCRVIHAYPGAGMAQTSQLAAAAWGVGQAAGLEMLPTSQNIIWHVWA